MSLLRLKLYRYNGANTPEIRRLSMSPTTAWPEVLQAINECFGTAATTLRYTDPDGDQVVVSSAAEWKECLAISDLEAVLGLHLDGPPSTSTTPSTDSAARDAPAAQAPPSSAPNPLFSLLQAAGAYHGVDVNQAQAWLGALKESQCAHWLQGQMGNPVPETANQETSPSVPPNPLFSLLQAASAYGMSGNQAQPAPSAPTAAPPSTPPNPLFSLLQAACAYGRDANQTQSAPSASAGGPNVPDLANWLRMVQGLQETNVSGAQAYTQCTEWLEWMRSGGVSNADQQGAGAEGAERTPNVSNFSSPEAALAAAAVVGPQIISAAQGFSPALGTLAQNIVEAFQSRLPESAAPPATTTTADLTDSSPLGKDNHVAEALNTTGQSNSPDAASSGPAADLGTECATDSKSSCAAVAVEEPPTYATEGAITAAGNEQAATTNQAAARVEDTPEVREVLDKLLELGFTDEQRNRELALEHNCSLQAVVLELTA